MLVNSFENNLNTLKLSKKKKTILSDFFITKMIGSYKVMAQKFGGYFIL